MGEPWVTGMRYNNKSPVDRAGKDAGKACPAHACVRCHRLCIIMEYAPEGDLSKIIKVCMGAGCCMGHAWRAHGGRSAVHGSVS